MGEHTFLRILGFDQLWSWPYLLPGVCIQCYSYLTWCRFRMISHFIGHNFSVWTCWCAYLWLIVIAWEGLFSVTEFNLTIFAMDISTYFFWQSNVARLESPINGCFYWNNHMTRMFDINGFGPHMTTLLINSSADWGWRSTTSTKNPSAKKSFLKSMHTSEAWTWS